MKASAYRILAPACKKYGKLGSEKGEKMPGCKISAFNYECIPLDWDTEYFGIKSARINLFGPANENEQEKIKEFCRNYDFVTIANLYNRKENNLWIGKNTNAFLTDINMQFIRQINDSTSSSCTLTGSNDSGFAGCSITITNTYEGNKKILDIAEKAFKFSRFFCDPFLPADLACNIYRQWSKDAFHKKDKYFTICCKDNEPVGYLLFSLNKEDGSSCIELIAVDIGCTGQGIGKFLIAASEAYIGGQGISRINVGTQADNIPAVRLYLGCGFKYSCCSSIYHLWN